MNTLGKWCDRFFLTDLAVDKNDLGCLQRSLEQFCQSGEKEDAFLVYFCFCEIFHLFGSGYDTMGKLLEFLSDHEYHSGELLSKHRDHYSHSVYVFALGLAIYANDCRFEKIIRDFYGQKQWDTTDFLKYWGLTALFHDIGYPFQLAHEQIKAYTEEMWGTDNPENPYVTFENMEGLLRFSVPTDKEQPQFSSVDDFLIYGIHCRLGYPLEILNTLLKKRYKKQKQFMDHGYFSAVLLTHKLLQAQTEMDERVMDVLSAIALHNNLNRYDLKKALGQETAISPNRHPLAYLLILCDELQNWDRTAFGYISKKDPLAWAIQMDITDNKIVIDYLFDSFEVAETRIKQDDRGDSIVAEQRRVNANVRKIHSGDFISELSSLLLCHTEIEVCAQEEKKSKPIKNFASTNKFVNLCDFARAIHASYRSIYKGPDYDELSLEFKLSNIEQAKSYADKLELINCFYSDKELDYPVVTQFGISDLEQSVSDELGFLAREEHVRWVKEKLQAGWKYGTDYHSNAERNAKKIHRDIVPYDCLPYEERAKDELMVRNMIPFLNEYGHGIKIYRYRTGYKPVLNIAGCGHRTINMNDARLKTEIKQILSEYQKNYRVVVRTNFAFGADQLIAQCANELGITIKATIPFEYETYIRKIKEDAHQYHYTFSDEDEMNMRLLLAQVPSLKVAVDSEYGYLEASKDIINKSQKLIALWDGVETLLEDEYGHPINQGGTWHNICIAKKSRGMKEEDIHIIKCDR